MSAWISSKTVDAATRQAFRAAQAAPVALAEERPAKRAADSATCPAPCPLSLFTGRSAPELRMAAATRATQAISAEARARKLLTLITADLDELNDPRPISDTCFRVT